MALYVNIANNFKQLSSKLAEIINNKPLPGVFDKEWFSVQTPGMRRWLSLELAELCGIFSSYEFLSPLAAAENFINYSSSGTVSQNSIFITRILPWAVFSSLQKSVTVSDKNFIVISKYVEINNEIDTNKLIKLSFKIAELFDQYMVYRYDLLKDWENNKLQYNSSDEKWQAILWKNLLKISPDEIKNRGADLANFIKKSSSNLMFQPAYPGRIHLFGVSNLPPVLIQFYKKLSENTDVFFYLLSPSGVFLQKNYKTEHILLRYQAESVGEFVSYFSDLDSIVIDADSENNQTLLSNVKKGLWQADAALKTEFDHNDSSIRIASCYSPLREVQALHDQLLDWLNPVNSQDIKPKDIAVLTPDITTYAPYIDAVFSSASPEIAIPYTLEKGSGIGEDFGIIETFLNFLEIPNTRMGLSRIMVPLQNQAVREKFCLTAYDIQTINQYLKSAGAAWGLDADFCINSGYEPGGKHTIKDALSRLLLGYAFRQENAHNEQLFESRLPAEFLEGSEAEIFGVFCDYIDQLEVLTKASFINNTLSYWTELTLNIINNIFSDKYIYESELARMITAVNSLRETVKIIDENIKIPYTAYIGQLHDSLAETSGARGFLRGKVTFASLIPLRSVPFRIICLLGMNDETFPRKYTPPGYDLIASYPQKGDRDIRKTDRSLFLETLLAAGDKLYISYVGRDIQTSKKKLPSPLVTELITHLEITCCDPDIEKKITIEHPLQPFSNFYFKKNRPDKRLFSYSKENCLVDKKRKKRQIAACFNLLKAEIPHKEELKYISLNDLINFSADPSGYFIKYSAGIRIKEFAILDADTELLETSGLDEYLLADEFLSQEDISRDDLLEIFYEKNRIPSFNLGKVLYQKKISEIQELSFRINDVTGSIPAKSFKIDLELDGIIINAELNNIYNNQMVIARPVSKIKWKDLVSVYLKHLILCSSGNYDIETFSSYFLCLNNKGIFFEFIKKESAEKELASWISRYKKYTSKIFFFPPISTMAMFEKSNQLSGKPDVNKKMIEAAEKAWYNYNGGELSSSAVFRTYFYNENLSELVKTISQYGVSWNGFIDFAYNAVTAQKEINQKNKEGKK